MGIVERWGMKPLLSYCPDTDLSNSQNPQATSTKKINIFPKPYNHFINAGHTYIIVMHNPHVYMPKLYIQIYHYKRIISKT
jgi:hypothetical protein